jgi:cation transport ATPase
MIGTPKLLIEQGIMLTDAEQQRVADLQEAGKTMMVVSRDAQVISV